MMQYDGDLLLPKTYLVAPPEIKGVSGEYLVKNGVTTFACSEVGFGAMRF
jgi:2,3-bisphosphoglycerate-independent phosphoglycerate mutase